MTGLSRGAPFTRTPGRYAANGGESGPGSVLSVDSSSSLWSSDTPNEEGITQRDIVTGFITAALLVGSLGLSAAWDGHGHLWVPRHSMGRGGRWKGSAAAMHSPWHTQRWRLADGQLLPAPMRLALRLGGSHDHTGDPSSTGPPAGAVLQLTINNCT